MKARNSKTAGPSLRDKLGENFLRAIQSDFEANGAAVIEQLRLKSPEKYTEIAARLIAATEPPASNRPVPNSTWEIGKDLLMQIGVSEYDLSDEMIERAVTANSRLLDEVESIAAMKASFETAELTMRDKN
jgi:hypothetical protein